MELDIKKSKRVHEGFLTLDILEIELPNGKNITRELVRKDAAVGTLAIGEGNQVFLTKQPRAGCNKLESIEISCGLMEKGEDPLTSAKRELLEETGCEADEWTSLGSFYLDPASCTTVMHLFLAKGAKQVQELNLDPDEYLECFSMSLDNLEKMIEDGTINDVNTVLAFERAKKYIKKSEE